jgi:copper(I)-binding protein
MMMLKTLAASVFAAGMMLASPLLAGDLQTLEVEDARALESLPGVSNGVVHMTIRNAGDRDDRLVAAATPAAKRAALHTHVMDGDIVRMDRVDALAVPAGGLVQLLPGGDHIMLIGLTETLTAGMEIPLSLTFEQAGRIELTVPVVAREAGHGEHEGHGDHERQAARNGDADVSVMRDESGLSAHLGHVGEHHHGAAAPAGVMGEHAMDAGQWMVSYRFMRMAMAGNRDGRRGISDEEIATKVVNRFASVAGQPPTLRVVPTEMTMDMHMLGAMYAPTDWLTVMAMASYLKKEMDHTTFAGGAGTTVLGNFTVKTEGIGDSRASALVRLHEDAVHHIHFSLGLGLPTGSIDETSAILAPTGARPVLRVPYPMQLGSGTYDALPGLTYTGHAADFSWGAQYGAVLRIGRNHEDYALGDEHRGSVWGRYALTPSTGVSLRFLGQDIARIDGIDSQIVAPNQTADPDNYGGRRFDVAVGFDLAGEALDQKLGGHGLSLEIGTPVYQKLNGPQLETDWLVTAKWAITF